jgi:hypothetical protein
VVEEEQKPHAETKRTQPARVPTVVLPPASAPTVKTAAATAKSEPVYERTLQMGSEYETAKRAPASGWRGRKWALAAAGSAAALVVLWAGVSFSQSDSRVEASSASPTAPAVVERTSTGSSRSTASRRKSSPSSAPAKSSSVDPGDHARALALVATGYRKLEKQDFPGAEAAFSQALEIEPDNAAAQRGLQAARTAQTVKGIAGVFGR